jgi:osmotically-inducible protein OsmY
MDDKVLQQNVIDELQFEPSVNAAHIGVAVEDGVVTLTGHVATYAEKLAAERAVQGVKGVKALAMEVQVRYPSEGKTDDDQIAKRAADVLAWNLVPPDSTKVSVQQGWIKLTGKVDWQYQKVAAESAVRKLAGVTGVTNVIEVKPRVEPKDLKHKIVAALHRNAQVEANNIQVSVEGGKVTLDGNVRAWFERGVVERAAWSAPGVTQVEDNLKVY